MNYKHNTPPEGNKPSAQFERVAVLRSAHGREDGHTFETQAAYIIGAGGARLIAGRSITRVAFGALTRHANAPAVLPFKPRRRFESADRRAA